MVMNQVNSSNIASVGYNVGRYTLRVEFQNGNVYRYSNVSPFIFAQFMAAKSKGRFLNSSIKPFHSVRRLSVFNVQH